MKSLLQTSIINGTHYIRIYLVFILFLTCQSVFASHLTGAEMYYDCISPNQYRISLVLYRNCGGIMPGNTQNVSINRCGNVSNLSLSLSGSYPYEISQFCDTTLSNCNGGALSGVDKWLYVGTVTFPSGCNNILVSFSNCCWSSAITAFNNPSTYSIYTEMLIDNTLSSCNNSSRFKMDPVLNACLNQAFSYSYASDDPDADSLVYSLVDCQSSSGNTVNYSAGYSGTNPLATASGIVLNPQSGAITFTPSTLQTSVLCVMVEEYRNGVKIAEQTRVTQIDVQNCGGNAPQLTALNYNASGVQPSFSYDACPGNNQICFDMIAFDPDATDSVFVSWDNNLAGASFTEQRISNDSVRITFCWTPANIGTEYFTVHVADNNCPMVNSNVFTLRLNVSNQGLPISLVKNDLSCFGSSDGAISANVINAVMPYSFIWNSGQTTSNLSGLPAGNYCVTVTDNNGCIGVSCESIIEPLAILPAISGSATAICNGNSVLLSANLIPGANYTWYYNGTPIQSGLQNTLNATSAGNYSCEVQVGLCTELSNVLNLQTNVFISTSVTPSNSIVCAGDSSTFTISAIPSAGLSYLWSTGENGPTISSPLPITHYVSVTDSYGCVTVDSVVLANYPIMSVSASVTQPISCYGFNDGAATATHSGGTAPFNYFWNNGQATAFTNGLSHGINYCITVVDANACEASNCISLTEPSQLDISTVVNQMTCDLDDGSILSTAVGGTGGYTFSWNGPNAYNNTASNINNLSSGIYYLTVTDLNGCEAYTSDTIDVITQSFVNNDYLISQDSVLNFTLQTPAGTPGFTTLQTPVYGTVVQQSGNNYSYTPLNAPQLFDTIVIRVCDGIDAIDNTVIVGIADCVWAGDTDTTQTVNNFDLLPIGLFYGYADNPRPNADSDWDCEAMTDWAPVTGQPNPKHSDTNGDGLVDDNDTLAIVLNWGELYVKSMNQGGGTQIFVDTASTSPGDTVRLPIVLGTSLLPANLVYGVAFTINYDNNIVDSNSLAINYDNSWLGTLGIDMLALSRDFYNLGRTDIAMVRTDHNTRSNTGPIAHIQFTIKDDVLKSNNLRMDLDITNVKLIDSVGGEIPVTALSGGVLVLPTGISTFARNVNLDIYPNPTDNLLSVKSSEMIEKLTLFDSGSRVLMVYENLNSDFSEINLENLPSGIFILKIQTSNGILIKKIAKK